ELLTPLGASVGEGAKLGGKARELAQPVVDQRGRRDHQRATASSALHEQRDALNGLAEPHLVGQARTRRPGAQLKEPVCARLLIAVKARAQVFAQRDLSVRLSA